MSRIKHASPALVISIIALVAALVVPALAQVATTALTKKEKRVVRKIARLQANKQINRRAPRLNVNSANTATSAGDAKTLDGDRLLYARVDGDGESATLVDGKGATSAAHEASGFPGTYSVTFNRSVRDCVKHVTAQMVRPAQSALIEASQFFVWVRSGSPQTVWISRANTLGNQANFTGADNGFALTLIC